MLESRIIRRDPERVKAACRLRGIDRSAEVDELAALDARRGELLSAARELREQQNLLRLRFPELERTGKSSVPLQIELRLLAHISDDTAMQEAFLSGEDIHATTAAHVFNVPPEQVTPNMRRSAKAVNFGIVYGISAFSLSKDIGVSVAEAKAYMDNYFAKYQGVKRYMEEVVEQAKETGYV